MQASLQASTREEAQGTHTHDVPSKQAGDERQLASLHVHKWLYEAIPLSHKS